MTGIDKILRPLELASLIDHTCLRPDATEADIIKLCDEAIRYRFHAVCVNPCWIRTCIDILKEVGIATCSVVGFPLGASTTNLKTREAVEAVSLGASEIDMVINIGAAKERRWKFVEDEIRDVVNSVTPETIVKVILETCYLDDSEKVRICRIAMDAGADFVKTSTGFGQKGATEKDVVLMRKTVSPGFGVKAAGGIRTYDSALKMIRAGANRLGTSASVDIINQCN